MRFNLLALALPLTLSVAAHAAPAAPRTAVVGTSATAPAVEKIVGDLMARLIPQVLASITQPEINIRQMRVQFGNIPGSTRVQELNGSIRVGLQQTFEYQLVGDNDIHVDGVPGLNAEMMKDFIPVVKIGPSQTIVGVDFKTLSQANSASNVIQSSIGFQGSGGEQALKIQVGSKKFKGIAVELRAINAVLTLNGDMVDATGTCDTKQEVAKLGFKNGKVQIIESRFYDAPCRFMMKYNLTTKEYITGLEYSSQQPVNTTSQR
jgi:hypothetical protein